MPSPSLVPHWPHVLLVLLGHVGHATASRCTAPATPPPPPPPPSRRHHLLQAAWISKIRLSELGFRCGDLEECLPSTMATTLVKASRVCRLLVFGIGIRQTLEAFLTVGYEHLANHPSAPVKPLFLLCVIPVLGSALVKPPFLMCVIPALDNTECPIKNTRQRALCSVFSYRELVVECCTRQSLCQWHLGLC